MSFQCEKCGLCCRNLNKNKLYNSLHGGDGVCKYLNIKTNLCAIYQNRPILCNVDRSYEKYFVNLFTLDEFHLLNHKGCEMLWNME